jgi:HEAT repeat protein
VEIGWKLLEKKDIFHLSLTPARLQNIRLQDYPRLYPHVQQAHSITFQPVPADAIVQHADDLKAIVGDARFTIKSVVFKGKLESLGTLREVLPGPLKKRLLLPESLAKEEAAHISGLIMALKDKEYAVRRSAASALGSIKSSSPEVQRGLLAALKDQNSYVRTRTKAS